MQTPRDPKFSFRAPQAYHDALDARAAMSPYSRSELIRAALRAAYPELSTGVRPGPTHALPTYARSCDSDEHPMFGGFDQNLTYRYSNVGSDREAAPAAPLKVPAAPGLSGISEMPQEEALRVGHATPAPLPNQRTEEELRVGHATPAPLPKAEPPHVSAPRYSGEKTPKRPEWTESAPQRKARLQGVVASVLEHGNSEQGQLERRRKMGASFGKTQELAARIYFHAASLSESTYWMLPTPRLSVPLWKEILEAVADVGGTEPEWQRWEDGFKMWGAHAVQDGPVGEAKINCFWRFLDRPKVDPFHPDPVKARERTDGPRFIERFADNRFIGWCNSAELGFYGSPEKRASVRSSAQLELALEVTKSEAETDAPKPSIRKSRKADPEFIAELENSVKTSLEREVRVLSKMTSEELKNLLQRLETGGKNQLRMDCELHPAFLERLERARAELKGRNAQQGE